MRKVFLNVLRPKQRVLPRHFSEFFPTTTTKKIESLPMPGKFKDDFKNPIANETVIPIDFYENKSEIFIDADLPGVVRIQLYSDVLPQ